MMQCNNNNGLLMCMAGRSSSASCLHSRHLINHHVRVNSEVVYT